MRTRDVRPQGGSISRRDVLRILALGGGAAALWRFGLSGVSTLHRVRETRLCMGTLVSLTLLNESPGMAREAMARVFTRIESLESVLSRFRSDSDVSRLNHTGAIVAPHPAMVEVLEGAAAMSRLTGGAFDVTVQPLIDAYEARQRSGLGPPGADEIGNLLTLVDWRALRVSAARVSFDGPGMQVVLDGIAKGFIVDDAAAVLRKSGFSNILMEAGGDLLALGRNAENAAWQIGVRSPRAPAADLLTSLDVSNRAVATSGDYLQPYSPDLALHHIVNPRTGISSPHLASATVVAPSCWEADALATAFMVMEVDEAVALARATEGVDTILVTKDLEVISSMRG